MSEQKKLSITMAFPHCDGLSPLLGEFLAWWAKAYGKVMADYRGGEKIEMTITSDTPTHAIEARQQVEPTHPEEIPEGIEDADTDLEIAEPHAREINQQIKTAITLFIQSLASEVKGPLKIVEINPGTGELTEAISDAAPDGSDVRCLGQWNPEGGGQDDQQDAPALLLFKERTANLPIDAMDSDPIDFALGLANSIDAHLVVITQNATKDLVDVWMQQVREGGALICFNGEAAEHLPGVMVRNGIAVAYKAEQPEEAVA